MSKAGSLIFYVGNGAVKCGVILDRPERMPFILSTRTIELPSRGYDDRNQLETRILGALQKLAREVGSVDMAKEPCRGLKIGRILVLLSSPWYVSKTAIIKIKEEKPFVVTSSLIQNAVDGHIGRYGSEGGAPLVALEQKVIKVSLNGYPTQMPIGKKASSLELTVFMSFTKKNSIDRIKDAIFGQFHNDKMLFHSQSLASFSVIRDVWKDDPDYILTDVTSELTELIVSREGQINETASFPMGAHFLVRKLSDDLHLQDAAARSLLHMYIEKTLEPSLEEKVEAVFSGIKAEWLAQFTQALSDISVNAALPSTFFLFSPVNVTDIFSDFILSEQYQQFSFSEGKFKVKKVRPSDLSGSCECAPGVKQDLAISVGAIFNAKVN